MSEQIKNEENGNKRESHRRSNQENLKKIAELRKHFFPTEEGSLESEINENITNIKKNDINEIKTIKDKIGNIYFTSKHDVPPQKECWICLQPESDGKIIKPCSCKGSTKYVHQECFASFLNAKKNIDGLKCQFCMKKYMIKSPNFRFLKFYERMGKANRFISNATFLLSLCFLGYFVMLIYGLLCLILFCGTEPMYKYLFLTCKDSNVILGYRYFNFIRVLAGAPMIPIVIISSTHHEFRVIVHVITPILCIQDISLENLILMVIPGTMYLYFKATAYLQEKMGKVEFTDDHSIMFNDNYLVVTKIVNGLMSPFFGILLGRCFLKDLIGIIYELNEKDFSKYETEAAIRFWSFIGCVLYVIGCDLLCFYYLYIRKLKMSNLIVYERKID